MKKDENTHKKMWEGRFSEASSKLLEAFNASINFDKNLFEEDIAGSMAHAKMLGICGILKEDEARAIINGLDVVLAEMRAGKFEFKIEDEDIHMAVEKRLSEIIGGELGGKLHTARSRNDQVALDFRLHVLKKNIEISSLIKELVGTLVNLAKSHKDTLMPGYTHLQHAQPVSLSYHLLAYAFMFKRDFERFVSSYERNNLSPLGSAALAGTPHKIDRSVVASELGFAGCTQNAMDSVSDRDFALEILFNISVFMTHTSRLCEELILWSSQEFGFVSISDAYSTGSSIMPQKKNPDVSELVRGKTGRVVGHLMATLTAVKGLPLAYNKDLQEDKEGLFDAIDTVKFSLSVYARLIRGMKVREDVMRRAVEEDFSNATDLADYLVRKGVPFRQAHAISGKAVALCIERGIWLGDMALEDYRMLSPLFDEDIYDAIRPETCVAGRNSYGGTSYEQVRMQLAAAGELIASEKSVCTSLAEKQRVL